MKYIFTALSEYGYEDTIIKAVKNPEMPSYAYWINQGSSTLCETWEMDQSLNHHMYSEIDYWLYRYVAGIQLDEKGLLIKPSFIVDSLKATHNGIEIKWDSDNIKVNLPAEAQLVLNNQIFSLEKGCHIFKR